MEPREVRVSSMDAAAPSKPAQGGVESQAQPVAGGRGVLYAPVGLTAAQASLATRLMWRWTMGRLWDGKQH